MSFPPIERLLPHKPPMIVIDEVIAAGDDWVETRLAVTEDHPLFDQAANFLPGWALIELMAQTIAAFAGVHDHAAGKPARIGYLLGTRRFEMQRRHVNAGEVLAMRAAREFHDPDGVGAFLCSVSDADGVIAEARINVYQGKTGETA